ncbi:MAG: response regulator [Aggregatilineales bacterium]
MPNSKSRHAFIVEDDAHSLYILGNLLNQLGIQFRRNTAGKDVIAQLKRSDPLPDFILMTLNLPDDGAFSICKRIRQDPELRELVIIGLANTLDDDLKTKTRKHDFTAMAIKPLSLKLLPELLDAIDRGTLTFESLLKS